MRLTNFLLVAMLLAQSCVSNEGNNENNAETASDGAETTAASTEFDTTYTFDVTVVWNGGVIDEKNPDDYDDTFGETVNTLYFIDKL